MGPRTRNPLPIIDAKGVMVARQTLAFESRGQIITAPAKVTVARIRAFNMVREIHVFSGRVTLQIQKQSFV
ncbi:hypothetical protein GCM10008927_30500 [Amylibacter ulvae]|uniref:Uncharacterized protein n=1 Tax=Paramylibacter ulvae TaxID=1651968 RepID=A0ABQ3D7L0_9RHOB|nr:hypothetical protein GCM10008927_30500 [Amylibacter ulvae]